jgi:hypothetical protein
MIIIVKKIDEKGRFNIKQLYDKYSSFLVEGAYIMCFVNLVFNDKSEIVLVPKISIESKFIVPMGYGYFIDLMTFLNGDCTEKWEHIWLMILLMLISITNMNF